MRSGWRETVDKIKLVAIDLDDTLLRSDKSISERNRVVLRQVRELGVAVTFSTGRMFRSALPFAEYLGFHAPLITYGGALIKHTGSGDVLYNRPLEPETSRMVIEFARERGLQVNFYYLNGDVDEVCAELVTQWGRQYGAVYRVPLRQVPDLDAVLKRGNPLKLLLMDDDPAVVDHCQVELGAQLGAQVHLAKSSPYFLEVNHPEATKGRALQQLASWLQVKRSQVLAIGDNYNDIEMLEYAGLGVAMANAAPEVQGRASYVTTSNEDDGVALALERFILDRPPSQDVHDVSASAQ
jgi:Cof subfamily protein (haloacid dehalogenase superfamily)